jgi:DNA polymerase-3 subunit gamma/tau
VARVADLFSEEDLARQLQIMLRTHSELGYRQEQRFHLELGLLKMVHAQRLLPIEELLSEAAAAPGRTTASVSPARSAAGPMEKNAPRPNYVSPFAADSARKGGSKPELSSDNAVGSGPRLVAAAPAPAKVVMGAAAPASVTISEPGEEAALPIAIANSEAPSINEVKEAVLNALADANQRVLVSMLETGEWKLEGSEVVIKVASSSAAIDMSVGNDAKRIIIASASGVLGRPAKLRVLPGGSAQTAPSTPRASNGGRGRAEQDPIVRRMQEKFGAEIRTVIDYREKK